MQKRRERKQLEERDTERKERERERERKRKREREMCEREREREREVRKESQRDLETKVHDTVHTRREKVPLARVEYCANSAEAMVSRIGQRKT